MKRYQLVDALAWERSVCTVLYASDDAETVEQLEVTLGEAMNQPLCVIDTWNRANGFPANAKPFFLNEQEVSDWLAKHKAGKNTSK